MLCTDAKCKMIIFHLKEPDSTPKHRISFRKSLTYLLENHEADQTRNLLCCRDGKRKRDTDRGRYRGWKIDQQYYTLSFKPQNSFVNVHQIHSEANLQLISRTYIQSINNITKEIARSLTIT